MNTTINPSNICAGYEPISGYKLEQLIGRGGFGEVWRSEAPGGLRKAVKFVYGATDQHRAIRELRSLERIKGVHHPFLLTLERFGVVDERLVIVTELADGSLEDVYNRHRERGSCGIPRAALLSYLHDAADGLDYLHTNYQLQHLDIKPGNLLLVGGHVKVGDFGLLKDLRDDDCSIVGGLTPVYAPPELFDGRPSIHSDQYSLAVMYQELITGTRPFSGRTIAQLATQHVHAAPNLGPLPASDRPIVAKALEKDPSRRYASCSEFIDELRASTTRPSRQATAPGVNERGDTLTCEFRGRPSVPSPTIKDLPQLKVAPPQGGVRITGHALVVALGGSGASVLHLLRERVAGHRAACPVDLHSVLIDTDALTIQAARLAEVSDRVPLCQAVHIPLKTPQEYRSYQGVKYKSISRRWLYNVPRSGATEGMRPLGRLALIDHGDEVVRQLKESIGHLAAVAGNATPSIYVVAAIDGGTGSGTVIDVVHLIRSILDDYSMADVNILPLLITGPMQSDARRPLAGPDAAATIAEIKYFLSPGNGYPGDVAANWPRVPAARTPLSEAYIIAAGLPGDSLPDPIDTACEYIWADSTGAGAFFAAARQTATTENESPIVESPSVRSLGMVRLRTPKMLEENLLAPSIARQLLYRWLGKPGEAKELAPDLATKFTRRCGITVESFLKNSAGQWSLERSVRKRRFSQWLASLPVEVKSNPLELQQAITKLAGQTLGSEPCNHAASVLLAVKREITARLSDGRCDLALAIELMKQLESFVEQCIQHCRGNDFGGLRSDSINGLAEATIELTEQADIWLCRIIAFNAGEELETLKRQLLQLRENLTDQAGTLAQCISQVSKRLNGNDDDIWQYVDEGIRQRVGSVLESLHKQASAAILAVSLSQEKSEWNSDLLLQSVLDEALPLIETAMSWQEVSPLQSTVPAQEPTSTSSASQKSTGSLAADIGDSDLSTTTLGEATSAGAFKKSLTANSLPANRPWDDAATIAEAIRAVRPALLQCGGCQRMLLIAGSHQELQRLEPKIREALSGPLTTTVISGAAAMLVCEAQQIKLSDVHSRIVTITGNQQDLMGRLAARNDIDWKVTTSSSR